jgi:hypothetical protein
MSFRCLALAILLASCGPPDHSPQADCARRADEDPTVKELMTVSSANTVALLDTRPRLQEARRQAVNRCLSGMGLQPPGGVESPNRPR